MRKKEITLPTILGLLLTVGGLISGILLLQGQVSQSAQAAVGEEPREIKISNVDDLGFVVSWTTDKAVSGFIQYSENGGTDSVVSDERDQQKGSIGSYFTHFVTVKGLKPDTTYIFKIGSGKNLYDGQGKEYTVKTGPTLADTPAADVAYGSVMTPSQEPAEGAIVYIEMPGVSTQAALVKSSGAWVIPLSTARSTDLASYAQYDKQTTKYDLTVVDGLMGSAAVVLTTGSSNPVPEITLGQNLDLTTQQQTETTQTTAKSRFLAETLAPASESGQLVVLTPNNGEKVNSNKPVVIGQAPAGTEITVEIHSETAIVNKIQAGSDGQFTYSVPQDLAPGEHTVTISAMINGVLKSVTRSFTVYAAGESSIPFYSASPSATISPSAATPTSKPGPSATPTPTLRPTPTTKVAPSRTTTPTATPLPSTTTTPYPTPTPVTSLVQSGNETPTLILMIAGVGMIFAGGWWYKKAS